MSRLIVNGFFRSGTSILWQALEKANPERPVLYEPCHPDLADLVAEAAEGGEAHPIHGFRLWDAYTPYLEDVARLHNTYTRGNRHVFAFDDVVAADYAHKLFEITGASVLQANRWHFVLNEISAATGARPMHLMRDPAGVYRSFQSIFRNNRSAWVGALLKAAAPNYLPPGSWEMLDALQQVSEYLPAQAVPLLRTRRFSPGKSQDVFLAVWLVSNAQAIRAAQESGGTIHWIEDIVHDPARFTAEIMPMGLRLDTSVFRPEKVGAVPTLASLSRYGENARRLGLERDFETVAGTLPDTRTKG